MIDLPAEQLAQVGRILARKLPGVEVRAFRFPVEARAPMPTRIWR